jgi:hypothetical protein
MEAKVVISNKNMPARFPLWPTITCALGLDRIHAPGWVWGVAGTIFLLIWIGEIYGHFTQVEKTPEWIKDARH